MKSVGANALISTMSNGVAANMVLQGVPASSLAAGDFIFADATPLNLTGTAGVDDLIGAQGADSLSAGDGNDRVLAGAGNDTVDAGTGNDSVLAQGGADSVVGGIGDDTLQGNGGNDSVSGGDGNDSMFGGKADDMLFGQAGNDTLSGDLGNDTLSGGAGADRFVLHAGGGADMVSDFSFAEGDRIGLSPGTSFTIGSAGSNALITLSTGDSIQLAGVSQASVTNDYIVFG
jgi:Ca2+-binding RTX toxin-like protein